MLLRLPLRNGGKKPERQTGMSEIKTHATPPGEIEKENGRTNIIPWDAKTAKVSMFGAGINKAASQIPYKQGYLLDVVNWINTPKMLSLTNELRSIKDEKLQKTFKSEKLPFVTFAGTFTRRKADGLIEYSGLQCFDFDHLGGMEEVRRVRTLLEKDPVFDTELMFTSPRGDGVKWVTHVDLIRGTYEKWYLAIVNYLRATYGLTADPAPKNVASACFLCWDAELVVNKNVLPY